MFRHILFTRTGATSLGIYAASEFAVTGLTRSAALELAPYGVRVVATLPHAPP
ncbi:SDR family NAD(P)-dependent oxidoreductase [Labrys miyagiensis]|uniref:SDR family NAD(P)-dependent oxidoreductase n=1 Tax=Labrys miyagiensis TaxID=346912 RepID=UPI003D67B5AB